MKKIILILVLIAGLWCNATAQPYYFKQYQPENGLSNNTVICCLQDRKGFMWFGTKDGLNRYDGYTFKIYHNNQDDPKSLGNNLVHTLYEDNDGTIWVGTENGIYKFNPEDESFRHMKEAPAGEILNILKDKKGNIWYIGGKKAFKISKGSGIIKMYDFNNSLSTSICMTPDGKIWLSSSTGEIREYNEQSDSFKSYNLFSHSPKAQSDWVVKLYSKGARAILVGTINQGLKSFDPVNHTYVDLLNRNPDHTGIFIRDIFEYKKNEIWLATESGVYIYNLVTKTVLNLKKQYNDPYSISYNSVYCIYRDTENGLWVGTYNGGINYYSPQTSLFKKYVPQYGSNSLSGTTIKRICKDKFGNLWIGSEDGGINKLDLRTGRFINFKPTGDKNSISYINIHGLCAIEDKIWIGTYQHGLDVMDIKTGKVVKHYQIPGRAHALESNFVICIYQTSSKDIYIGTGYGLYRYNKLNDNFTFIHSGHIQTITEDREGLIWMGLSQSGLFSFDPAGNLFESKNFANKILNIHSANSNNINGIFEDSNAELWITTENGLYEVDKNRTLFKRYNIANGLPSNVTQSTLEDGNKTLWISTSEGLVAMNLKTKKLAVFTKNNGLLTNQFNYDSAFKDDDGNMYFGCIKGFISFKPSALINYSFVPPVYITGLQVNNQELKIGGPDAPLKKSIVSARQISLKYDQSSLSIDFAAPNFSSPAMLQYAYKMEGVDKEWTVLKSNRKVYFTDLSPGKYVFKIRAGNGSGFLSRKPTELVINIEPPLWKSIYAYAFYLAVSALIIYNFIRRNNLKRKEKYRRKFELFENEKEREIYQAKIEFFTHITHEIRTPLTLIKGPLDNIIKTNDLSPATQKDLKLLERNTVRLLDLTNQLLDFRKVESKHFNLNFVRLNLSGLLESIFRDFEPVAERKNQLITIKLPPSPLFVDGDTEVLHKILNNLFTNAVKYAGKEIRVRLFILNDKFAIELKNDGYLIPDELVERVFEPFFRAPETDKQQGSGIGLALTRSLVELHNGTLVYNRSVDDLNTFTLALPLHQQDTFTFYDEIEVIPEITMSDDGLQYSDKPLVLVVEDNIEISNFLFNALSSSYAVAVAGNGLQALEVLNEKTVHLILSDVVMPLMDGFELCKKVKTTLDYSHIPIILLTAKNALQSKIEGLESGADAYIEKPFSQEHLLAQISNLLKNRDKIKLHFANSPLINIKSIAYSKADEEFLEKLNNAILKYITSSSLDVEQLAEVMNMSRPTLYRKIKAISNLTPNELINIARLKKAAELLTDGNFKIYEIADMVGYGSQTYFGQCFFKQFGVTPSEYLQARRAERRPKAS